MLSYHVQENDSLTQMGMPHYDGNIYHPRTMSVGPGFSVGFITELRLTKHLNLRFTPSLSFGERSISYKSYTLADSLIGYTNVAGNKPSILTIPVSIPLYLKWSAEREANYRPYVIVGGGIQTPQAMIQAFDAGADIVVIGNHFEQHPEELSLFIHSLSYYEHNHS